MPAFFLTSSRRISKNLINWNASWSVQPNVDATSVPTFLCPSEIHTQPNVTATLDVVPVHYGVNAGTWFQWDPITNQHGDGTFLVNDCLTSANFTDGMSNTLGMAEVKTYQANLIDGDQAVTPTTPPPATPAQLVAYGGNFQTNFGHVNWANGIIIHTGMTTTFPPNTFVPYVNPADGNTYDVDFTSVRLGTSLTLCTNVSFGSRSYHPSGINAMMMDGSCRFFSNTIAQATWRALGTPAGGEIMTGY